MLIFVYMYIIYDHIWSVFSFYVFLCIFLIWHTTPLGASLALRLESTLRDWNERGAWVVRYLGMMKTLWRWQLAALEALYQWCFCLYIGLFPVINGFTLNWHSINGAILWLTTGKGPQLWFPASSTSSCSFFQLELWSPPNRWDCSNPQEARNVKDH